MAERLHHSPEQHQHTPEVPKHHHEASHEATQHHHKENIENIRAKAAHEARAAHKVDVEESSHRPHERFVNAELRDLAYSRTMNRVRKQLSPLNRGLSKVIHLPVVDAASEGMAKTVGRPSGILGGGILALAGTTAYYYIAKHYGYEYNFGVFLVLLGSGFIIGWACEYLYRAFRPSR